MTIYNSLLHKICLSITVFETYVFGEVEFGNHILFSIRKIFKHKIVFLNFDGT